jgi:hypothetical protein
MAKALLGHVGVGPDARLLAEVRRLRDRVRLLEREVSSLEAANAALSRRQLVDGELTLAETSLSDALSDQREPAYT